MAALFVSFTNKLEPSDEIPFPFDAFILIPVTKEFRDV